MTFATEARSQVDGEGRIHPTRRGYQMKTRILFSMALIAVLFVFWLIMSKPACLADETASLGPRLEWTCLPR